jgi:hypothetical protein
MQLISPLEMPMPAERMVFQSIYVERDVDVALRAEAAKAGASKGEMFRRYLRVGMVQPMRCGFHMGPRDASQRLRVRSVYLPVELDEALKARAFDMNTTKGELIRQILREGMLALQVEATAHK